MPNPGSPDDSILIPLAENIRESLDFYSAKKDGWMLKSSPESEKLWDKWYSIYWKRKRGDELIPALNNGDRTTCKKIALINAFLDRSERFIEPHHYEPAMAFCEFLFESRWPIFSDHGANPYVEMERKILAKVPEYPTQVRKRWLQQQLPLDSKTFNDRLKYMSMEDGPLETRRASRNTVFIWRRQ
jgi:hypothetical protein